MNEVAGKRELSDEERAMVAKGLGAIGYTGNERIAVPPNVHNKPERENQEMIVAARDLGYVCIHMFGESMPPEALQVTLDDWRLPDEDEA